MPPVRDRISVLCRFIDKFSKGGHGIYRPSSLLVPVGAQLANLSVSGNQHEPRKALRQVHRWSQETLDTYGVKHDAFDFESELGWEGSNDKVRPHHHDNIYGHVLPNCQSFSLAPHSGRSLIKQPLVSINIVGYQYRLKAVYSRMSMRTRGHANKTSIVESVCMALDPTCSQLS